MAMAAKAKTSGGGLMTCPECGAKVAMKAGGGTVSCPKCGHKMTMRAGGTAGSRRK